MFNSSLTTFSQVFFLALVVVLSACAGQSRTNNADSSVVDSVFTADTAAFICPMFCEGDSAYHATQGICSVCGMDLMEKGELDALLERGGE